MADMNFLFHCVQWIKNLSERQEVFVDISVGDFTFVFENKEKVKKNRSPSQLKRDEVRSKLFKSSCANDLADFEVKIDHSDMETQTFDTSEAEMNEVQYEIRIDAHEKLRNYDIVEAIEENFYGGLQDRNICREDPSSSILIHNYEQDLKENTNGRKLSSFVYRLFVKNNDIPKSVVEDWINPGRFDDLAFRSAVRDKMTARVMDIRKIA